MFKKAVYGAFLMLCVLSSIMFLCLAVLNAYKCDFKAAVSFFFGAMWLYFFMIKEVLESFDMEEKKEVELEEAVKHWNHTVDEKAVMAEMYRQLAEAAKKK